MKPRRLRIEVEPLSEARWQKVDAAVQSAIDGDAGGIASGGRAAPPEPNRRRPQIMAAVVVAAIAVAAAGIAVVRSPGPREGLGKTALTSSPTASGLPSHIETGAGRTFVSLGFASLDVGPESALTSSGNEANGVVVVLEKGSVECDVAPRTDRPPFVVQAGDVRVRVVGTRFVVQRDSAGAHVEVKHGTVEVSHDGIRSSVHEGERWPAVVPSPSSALEPPPLQPAAEPSGQTTPAAARPPVPSGSAPISDQQLYERAARLEARDPEGAIAIYERLAARNGVWSPNALFAAGRLSAEKGNRTQARRYLEHYLAQYPRGPNADDCRTLLARLRANDERK